MDDNLAEQFERLPPHSIEAEQCVLASMLLDEQMFHAIRGMICKQDFYQADNQILFSVACEIYDKRGKIDGVLLMEGLRSRQLFEEIGGKEYLRTIFEAIPIPAHGEHYAAVVKDRSIKRQIIAASNSALAAAYGPCHENDGADQAAKAAGELAKISTGGSIREPVKLEEAVHAVLEREGRPSARRIPTGLKTLDEIIGGIALSRYTIIGAKGGMGKSCLGKQIALNVASNGFEVGIVTVEENREKIAENLLANASGIENHRISYNSLHPEDWRELVKATPKLAALPVWIDDCSFTLREIIASIQRLVAKYKCKMVFVDHIHLVDGQAEKNSTREREIAKISGELKTTFRKLDVAGVVMAQLNRAGERGERPDLRSLRDSGSLEADGDTVVLLHREDYYRWKEAGFVADHVLEAIVAKNKDGRVGTANLNFDGATQTIKDIE